jgi:hypothetical protein
LSDHPGGRAIDLRYIARKNEPFINLGPKNVDNNYIALHILLETLNSLPKYLHPDLITFDDRLEAHGVSRGYGGGSVLKKKYPNLSDISFGLDGGHRDHMHIAFSPYRAGNYIDYTTSGPTEDQPEGIAPISGPTTVPPQNYDLDAQVLCQPRMNVQTKLTAEEQKVTYKALVKYGEFKPETAALFMMLAERESHFGPMTLNAKISGSGDYSFTMWQLNYYGNPGKGLQSVNVYPKEPVETFIDLPGIGSGVKLLSLGQPTRTKAWRLVLKNWRTHGEVSTHDQLREVFRKYDASKPEVLTQYQLIDELATSIINQIMLLKQYVNHYTDRKGWRFTNWGEYDGAAKYGWIRKTKFKTAVKFYLENNPGATEEILRNHVRRFYFNRKRRTVKCA